MLRFMAEGFTYYISNDPRKSREILTLVKIYDTPAVGFPEEVMIYFVECAEDSRQYQPLEGLYLYREIFKEQVYDYLRKNERTKTGSSEES